MIERLKDITIKIKLHTLSRHRKVDKWGKAEPYLWIIFFKVDGHKLSILPDFRLQGTGDFYFAPGSHGNLGISSINDESTVEIPSEIGEWITTMSPLQIPHFEQTAPGMLGVICALMEQNNVTYKGAEAGHQALNLMVERAVNNALKSFDPRVIDLQNIMESIGEFFEKKVEDFMDGMETKIVEAIKKNQNLFQNLWSLVKADNLIGYQVWHFDHSQIDDAPKEGIDFTHHWVSDAHGDWEIFGNVKKINPNTEQHQVLSVAINKEEITPERAPKVSEEPDRQALNVITI